MPALRHSDTTLTTLTRSRKRHEGYLRPAVLSTIESDDWDIINRRHSDYHSLIIVGLEVKRHPCIAVDLWPQLMSIVPDAETVLAEPTYCIMKLFPELHALILTASPPP